MGKSYTWFWTNKISSLLKLKSFAHSLWINVDIVYHIYINYTVNCICICVDIFHIYTLLGTPKHLYIHTVIKSANGVAAEQWKNHADTGSVNVYSNHKNEEKA